MIALLRFFGSWIKMNFRNLISKKYCELVLLTQSVKGFVRASFFCFFAVRWKYFRLKPCLHVAHNKKFPLVYAVKKINHNESI